MTNGKPQLENGYIQIANQLLLAMTAFPFTQLELKMLNVVLLCTKGRSKIEAGITLKQFNNLTKVSPSHVSATLTGLVKNIVIIRQKKNGRLHYKLNEKHTEWLYKGNALLADYNLFNTLFLTETKREILPEGYRISNPWEQKNAKKLERGCYRISNPLSVFCSPIDYVAVSKTLTFLYEGYGISNTFLKTTNPSLEFIGRSRSKPLKSKDLKEKVKKEKKQKPRQKSLFPEDKKTKKLAPKKPEPATESTAPKKPVDVSYPTWLNVDLFKAYIVNRKFIKSPMSDYAQTLAIKKLHRLMNAGEDQTELIEAAIENNWKSFYARKSNQGDRYGKHKKDTRTKGQILFDKIKNFPE